MSKLLVNRLSKTRAYDEIFSNVSFELLGSEMLWLKGANGSGKTSLLRILAKLSQATAGEVQSDVDSFHYVSHQLNLIDVLSVKETIEQLLPCYGVNNANSVSASLETLGLAHTENLRISQLSAGQKQRLKLLSLSLEERALWLLDEPYSHLDNQGRLCLDKMMTEHLAKKGLIVITCHSESLGIEPHKVLELGAGFNA